MASYTVSGLLLLSAVLVLTAEVSAKRRQRGVCGNGESFCENPSNYPQDRVNAILKRDGSKHSDMFGVESEVKPPENIITSRLGGVETPLCKSRSEIIYPKAAQNKNGEEKFIVNGEQEYIQGVRVEMCAQPGGECSFAQNFAGYTTQCVQKYVYRRLLAVGDQDNAVVDEFRFPSCCSCTVTGPPLK